MGVKSVLELEGIGKNKEALLVGGGHSINNFKWEKLPDDITLIGVNWVFHRVKDIKYIIYGDKYFKEWLETDAVHYKDKTKYIGFYRNICDKTDYSYSNEDILIGFHTGSAALQIVAKIMGFRTYLIGFDYYDKDGVVHGFGDKIHSKWQFWNHFLIEKDDYFLKDIKDFHKINWLDCEIFNCNKESGLKLFPYGVPYA